MKFLIATGIFPPQLGGPAKYAKELQNEWQKQGNAVRVKTYHLEHALPSGIRHIYFFLKILPAVLWSNCIVSLDTFSVGFPATVAARIFGKKILLRTGGDFLWEGYVERTNDLVLLKDFYTTTREKWSGKERLIFKLTRWTLRHVSALIFTTEWQKNIFTKAYDLKNDNIYIVENYYGLKQSSLEPKEKIFIAGTRKLKWKNLEQLKKSFQDLSNVRLDLSIHAPNEYMNTLASCYAVILVSLGDISPNMILEAITSNKPFILTKENGISERVKDIALFVDPRNVDDIRSKITWLSDEKNYTAQVEKLKNFTFTHTWPEIAKEFIDIYRKL